MATSPISCFPCSVFNATQSEETNYPQKILLALSIIGLIGGILSFYLAFQFPITAESFFYLGIFSLMGSFICFSLSRSDDTDNQWNGLGTSYRSPFAYRISIEVRRQDIKANPQRHLREFVEEIEEHILTNTHGGLRVRFIGERGIDASGLTKDFLDDLLTGATELGMTDEDNAGLAFKRVPESGLVVPQSRNGDYDLIYQQIGKVMQFCYPSLQIGSHFDISLFRVIANLNANEINQPYASLSNERKLELYNIITFFQQDNDHAGMLNYLSLEANALSEEQLKSILAKLGQATQLPLDFYMIPLIDEMNHQENIQKMKNALRQVNQEDLLLQVEDWGEQQLREASRKILENVEAIPEEIEDLFEELDFIDEERCQESIQRVFEEIQNNLQNKARLKESLRIWLSGIYDLQVRGMHAIAQGMKSVCVKGRASTREDQDQQWNTAFYCPNPNDFNSTLSDTLQGKFDREFIATHIVYTGNNQAIQQKIEWLQEWVRDQNNSDLKVRKLCKFITGSTALAHNGQIRVHEQNEPYSANPVTHTCFNTIDLAPAYCGSLEFRNEEDQVVEVNRVIRRRNDIIGLQEGAELPQGVREAGVHDRTKEGFWRIIEGCIGGESAGYSNY